jgi:uncharacterized protein (TIGR00369 family)
MDGGGPCGSYSRMSVTGTQVSRPRAEPNDGCVICGKDNPRGLRIEFSQTCDGTMTAPWRPSSDLEGFRGVVHGGVIAAALDEAMSKAVASKGWPALTCELRVRFRRSVRAGESLRIRGWVVEKRKRQVLAEASLCREDGAERAHASAVFLIVR